VPAPRVITAIGNAHGTVIGVHDVAWTERNEGGVEGRRSYWISRPTPVTCDRLLAPTLTVIGDRDCTRFGRTVATSAVRIAKRLDIPLSTGCHQGIEETALESALQLGVPVVLHLDCAPDQTTVRQQRLVEKVTTSGGVVVTTVAPGTVGSRTIRNNSTWLLARLAAPLLLCEGDERSEAFDLTCTVLAGGGPVIVPMPPRTFRAQPSLRGPLVLAGNIRPAGHIIERLDGLLDGGQYANAVCSNFDDMFDFIRLLVMFGRNPAEHRPDRNPGP